MSDLLFNELLNERIYIKKLPSGINCYIIPKEGYVEKQAIISVKYGSIDNDFELDGKKYEMPDGIAHFLEHKIFEDPEKVVFNEFNRLGATVNAFTNFTNTAYYFTCRENFDKNLELLIDFVQTPYFTNENVAKEKNIIASEIEMYQDDPFWAMYFNMQDAMYFNNPVKKNIAGTVDSVNQITKEMLYDCYNAFYVPNNMVLVCVGDFQPEHVLEVIEKNIRLKATGELHRNYGEEPSGVRFPYTKKQMQLSQKMFNLGFKDGALRNISDKIVSTKIMMDYCFGESSLFFENLYCKGIIDNPLSLEFVCSVFFGTAVIAGSSQIPEEVSKLIFGEIENVKNGNMDLDRFERIRKKHVGRFIRSFNNINTIATSQVDLFSKSLNLFDILHSYESLTPTVALMRLISLFRDDNHVLSVVEPIEN